MNVNPFKFFGFFNKNGVDLEKKSEKPPSDSRGSLFDMVFKKEPASLRVQQKHSFVSTNPPSIYSRISKSFMRFLFGNSENNQNTSQIHKDGAIEHFTSLIKEDRKSVV